MSKDIFEEIIFTGRVLHELGLVSSHGGNLSIRDGDYIYITKTGKMAGFLKEEDIVILPLFEESQKDKEASIELIVHREIYRRNPHLSGIVHAHPVYATTLGYFLDSFTPIDIEGELFIKKAAVVSVSKPSASSELAQALADVFSSSFNTAIVRSHGSFSVGKSINEALKYTSTLENSAKIYYRYHLWKTR